MSDDLNQQPKGAEREVKFLGGAAIDGAPVAYIVVLAAVNAALAFIPMSVVMASGGSFPMSQGVWALTGWLLGPIAGALATGIGALIGIFIAPHTAGVPAVTIIGALFTAFAAGVMVKAGSRTKWWIPVAVLAIIGLAIYAGRALTVNAVSPHVVFMGTFINWSALLILLLPTRKLISEWLSGDSVPKTLVALFLGTWSGFGLAHAVQCSITYTMFNWPEEVWVMLIPMMPFENLMRCIVAVVIGGGVIAGLRAIGLVKPEHAQY